MAGRSVGREGAGAPESPGSRPRPLRDETGAARRLFSPTTFRPVAALPRTRRAAPVPGPAAGRGGPLPGGSRDRSPRRRSAAASLLPRAAPAAVLGPLLASAVAAAPLSPPGETPSEDSRNWSAVADLNFALSSGNARNSSFGLDAEAEGGVGRWRLRLQGGAFRAGAATVRREAVGAADAFEVRETVERQTSANRGYFRARLGGAAPEPAEGEDAPERADRGIRGFAAAGWERDLPAGVRSRYDLTAGVGKQFGGSAPEAPPLRLSAGLSFVRQRDLVPDPDTEGDTFAVRLEARSGARLRAVDLGLVAATVWNLRQRADLRVDATGSAEAPLSRRLALRASLQTLFDARPALERIPLTGSPGAAPTAQVAVRRERLDLILFVSLAVRW